MGTHRTFEHLQESYLLGSIDHIIARIETSSRPARVRGARPDERRPRPARPDRQAPAARVQLSSEGVTMGTPHRARPLRHRVRGADRGARPDGVRRPRRPGAAHHRRGRAAGRRPDLLPPRRLRRQAVGAQHAAPEPDDLHHDRSHAAVDRLHDDDDHRRGHRRRARPDRRLLQRADERRPLRRPRHARTAAATSSWRCAARHPDARDPVLVQHLHERPGDRPEDADHRAGVGAGRPDRPARRGRPADRDLELPAAAQSVQRVRPDRAEDAGLRAASARPPSPSFRPRASSGV